MKKFFSTLVMLTVVLALSAQEQKQEPKRGMEVRKEGFMKANPVSLAPKLTADQQKQMAEFRLNLQKEMLQIDNQLNVRRAELKALQQVEKPNMKSIYSKIDEITGLQNKKMKAKADHQNQARSILTEEQRIQFDMMRDGVQGGQGMKAMQGQPGKGCGMECCGMHQEMKQSAQPPKMMRMNQPDSMKMQKAKN